MSYTFVSANKTATGTLSLTISAGQQVIIIAGDEAAQNATLTMSDGTNTYAVRGTRNDTRNNATRTLIDCLSPAPGSYTLTLAGAATPNFIALVYTGISSYSAGSFASAFFGATPSTVTDAMTTTAITPTSYPAMIVGLSQAGSLASLSAGTGFTSRFATTNGMAFADAGYAEDMEILSGSHIASFTYNTSGGDSVTVLGAAYIEGAATSPVVPSGLGFFGTGPGPRGPFNNNQFRSFPFSTQPLSANAWFATLAEPGAAADALNSTQAMIATLTEAGVAADTVTAALAMSLALAEAGAAADSLVATAAFVSSLSEAGGGADALTSTWAAVAAIAAAGSALDAYVNVLAMSSSLTESGSAADSSTGGLAYTATVTEPGAAADSSAASVGFNLPLTEAGVAADSSTTIAALSVPLTETGSAAAAVNAALTAILALSEAANAVDALGLSVNLSGAVNEAGAALDAFVNALTFNSALIEAGSALDALATSQSSGGLFPTRLLTTGFYTQLLASQAGALPYGEFFTYKGDVIVYGIDWAGFLANYWQRGGLVAANAVIRPTNPTGFQLATVLGGQSGSTEPVCPTTIGQTVQDGSVLWVCQAVDTTSLYATVASVTWAPATGITVTTQSVAGQLTIAKLDATAATAGQSYAVDAHVLMSDGETKTGRIVLKAK